MSSPSADRGIVVLLDIDGTLLDARGAGREAFFAGFRSAHPEADLPEVSMAGRTDFGLFHELDGVLAERGSRVEGFSFEAFLEAYVPELEAGCRRRPPRLVPGAEAFCRALRDRPGFLPGLVTGNFRAGAWIKLEAAGLAGCFDPDGPGAYGGAAPDKGALAREALGDWSARTGSRPPAVVLGDTSEDVRCAREAGLACLALATGREGRDDLLRAGAEAVLPDLSELELCLSLVRLLAR